MRQSDDSSESVAPIPRGDVAAAALLLISVVLAFGWRAQHGIWFSTFSDETGHIVGAKAIAAGYKLYRDFVDEHGPLIYALPQLYGALAGWNTANYVRVLPIICMLATSISLFYSPALKNIWERLVAAAIFVGLTGTVWLVQALFMLDYQPLAGMLLVIGLAQFTLPVWYGSKVGPASLITAGLAFGLTPFVAFTYGPASLLLGGSGVWVWVAEQRGTRLRYLFLAIAAAVLGTLVWMAAFASFPGYLAYHYIAAIRFYAPYMPQTGPLSGFTALWPGLSPPEIVQGIGVAALVASAAALVIGCQYVAISFRRLFVPFTMGCLGVVLTNPRGSPIFQDGAFIVVAFALAALTFPMLPRTHGQIKTNRTRCLLLGAATLAIAASELSARNAVSTPHGYTRSELVNAENGRLGPSDAPWARKLRLLTDPGEPTLALPFYPDFYLQAGRLPMKAYFVYLPWDADFGRHPVLGLTHDICSGLAQNPPPVVYYNGWVVWGKYDPRTYMPCVLDLLSRLYVPMPGEANLYVRSDRVARLHS